MNPLEMASKQTEEIVNAIARKNKRRGMKKNWIEKWWSENSLSESDRESNWFINYIVETAFNRFLSLLIRRVKKLDKSNITVFVNGEGHRAVLLEEVLQILRGDCGLPIKEAKEKR